MAGKLFDRVLKVNVDGEELHGFDADVTVALTDEKEPNKATVKIFNLATDLQASARKKDARLEVIAGYKGQDARIFLGDIRYANSGITGSDWLTTIEAGDGERAYRDSGVKLSWKKGKPVSKVVEEILDTFENVELGNFATTFKADVQDQFPSGAALSGASAQILSDIVAPYGYTVSIQQGKFQFLLADGRSTKVAVKISPQTGLINEPEIGEPDPKTKKAAVKVVALCQPTITPGQVFIVSGTHGKDGEYVAVKVTHTLSNWQDQPFYTSIEAKT